MQKRIEYEQVTFLDPNWIREQISHFMEEDVPEGDITTNATVTETVSVVAKMVSADSFVFCGEYIIPLCFPNPCQIDLKIKDGDWVQSGKTIANIMGPAGLILTYERIALNLIQRLCGISTETEKYCNLDLPENFKVMDTRKMTPGLRKFEKYAVSIGGGWNHRLNLSSGILIKDNHLKAAGSIKNAVNKSRQKNKNNFPIELEVDTLEQLQEGLAMGVDGFLLDNMSPEMVKEAVGIIRNVPGGESIFVEASGNIHYDTLESYAWTGIDGVSMSAITAQAKVVDIKLEFE
ncbi:MAG: carboxylating nicotinate-nucleotide diphosphorylase [Candidatus Marinimicrobia bacterium]|mgnify:FL=1|jgi:nicotinate-nucleotide pyrophosphorylase (carboxylating)|nr:carboxylating nicotinate-nucleotide diphosphorylase [Candidatus Neomarinimicrobiota bacterium]MBT3501328.1 carboxylating nicotinate-nucleotide diphosphorylase [Candidatus Neomarinimicrobiota bacterium]MBT3838528.1 carboxylating nicotinate-nucleotide diphosphorylase [Candidatus Neomarinimicrobiota bacterium]MBT3999910.1 carboxylating nicotinate-nucleotide diphosphorylase [Candidatus Neomarinimicrobiota bacterium]MBT4282559.1 carboxylating nicotinate-nucleotide diphosphorylase [Candidatus Neom